jgi:hypothetical protein
MDALRWTGAGANVSAALTELTARLLAEGFPVPDVQRLIVVAPLRTETTEQTAARAAADLGGWVGDCRAVRVSGGYTSFAYAAV